MFTATDTNVTREELLSKDIVLEEPVVQLFSNNYPSNCITPLADDIERQLNEGNVTVRLPNSVTTGLKWDIMNPPKDSFDYDKCKRNEEVLLEDEYRKTFVYFIRFSIVIDNVLSTFLKVGYATNLGTRLRYLSVDYLDIEILGLYSHFERQECTNLEGRLHEYMRQELRGKPYYKLEKSSLDPRAGALTEIYGISPEYKESQGIIEEVLSSMTVDYLGSTREFRNLKSIVSRR